MTFGQFLVAHRMVKVSGSRATRIYIFVCPLFVIYVWVLVVLVDVALLHYGGEILHHVRGVDEEQSPMMI
jgi:hypothetical protein